MEHYFCTIIDVGAVYAGKHPLFGEGWLADGVIFHLTNSEAIFETASEILKRIKEKG